jgi:hypothetical protein
MADSQAQANITRSFLGEGPVTDVFAVRTTQIGRGAFDRCVATANPLELVFRPYGYTSANRGNAQVGNGPFGDLVRGYVGPPLPLP